ncbi:NAD-dependent epimerase/dehydratase family protein, partial [Albidovulum sp.]
METELRGCRVLVTGASGFIGRRLVAALRDAGAEVTALTRSRAAAAALPPG